MQAIEVYAVDIFSKEPQKTYSGNIKEIEGKVFEGKKYYLYLKARNEGGVWAILGDTINFTENEFNRLMKNVIARGHRAVILLANSVLILCWTKQSRFCFVNLFPLDNNLRELETFVIKHYSSTSSVWWKHFVLPWTEFVWLIGNREYKSSPSLYIDLLGDVNGKTPVESYENFNLLIKPSSYTEDEQFEYQARDVRGKNISRNINAHMQQIFKTIDSYDAKISEWLRNAEIKFVSD